MIKLKYTGKLGYLEARWRLGLGDRAKLLERIDEEKKNINGAEVKTEPEQLDIAKNIFI